MLTPRGIKFVNSKVSLVKGTTLGYGDVRFTQESVKRDFIAAIPGLTESADSHYSLVLGNEDLELTIVLVPHFNSFILADNRLEDEWARIYRDFKGL